MHATKEDVRTLIITRLDQIIKKVPRLKIIYKYDTLYNEHLVKVLPRHEYNSNEIFEELESDLILDVITTNPMESIVFYTNGEGIDINNPDIIFEGVNYKNRHNWFSETTRFNWLNANFILDYNDIDTFDIGQTLNEFCKNQKVDNSNLQEQEFGYDHLFMKQNFVKDVKFKGDNVRENCKCCPDEHSDFMSNICGENNFALAA